MLAIAHQYRHCGAPAEDLVQLGNLGLLKAIDRFDLERGARLAGYAAYWIRSEIREYVVTHYRKVRLGSSPSSSRRTWS